MKKLQVYNNGEFEAKVRITDNGDMEFDIEEVSKNLGFTQAKNDIHYVRWERVNEYLHSFGFSPEVGKGDFIPEQYIYLLGMKAENDIAIRYQKFLAFEVMPTIRKEGAYITNKANPEKLRAKADKLENLTTLNETANILLPVLDNAGLKPQYKAIALKQIYRKAGIDIPVEELKADREIFDLTTIAKTVGIYSASNKPHGQAVSAIISKLDISDEEKELVSYENNGHTGTTTQYTKSVIDKVINWLKENEYPNKIPRVSKGKSKTFNVTYKVVA